MLLLFAVENRGADSSESGSCAETLDQFLPISRRHRVQTQCHPATIREDLVPWDPLCWSQMEHNGTHLKKYQDFFFLKKNCLIWVSLNVLIAYCARDLHLDCILIACCLHAVYMLSTCCLHISLLWMHLRSVELLFLFGCCRMLPPRSRSQFFPFLSGQGLCLTSVWYCQIGSETELNSLRLRWAFAQVAQSRTCSNVQLMFPDLQRLKEVNSNDPSSPASR